MLIAIPLREIQAFILVLFRVSGIFAFAPIFGSRAIPPFAKVAIALGCTVLIFPALAAEEYVIPNDAIMLTAALAGELLIGVAIGLLASVITASVQFSGRILGIHMGFRIANVIDPQSEISVSLLGAFYNLVTMLVLLNLDFHIIILRVIKESFTSIRPLGVNFNIGVSEVILRAGANIFLFAVQVAAPVLAALFFVEVIIAVLAKNAREFNMLMMQFAIKIMVGGIMVIATLKVVPQAVKQLLRITLDQIGEIIRMLG